MEARYLTMFTKLTTKGAKLCAFHSKCFQSLKQFGTNNYSSTKCFSSNSMFKPNQFTKVTWIANHQFSKSCTSTQIANKDKQDSTGRNGPPIQNRIFQRLVDIDERMRYHGYSTVRIGLAVIVATGLGIYVFREYIRANVADEVSTVATMSLGDVSVKMKVQELAVALIQTLLNNEDVQKQAVQFLHGVFNKPESREAITMLLIQVLSDTSAQAKLVQTLKHILSVSLSDEAFRRQFAANLRLLLQDESTRAGLLDLLQFALNDNKIHTEARNFLQQILASDEIRTEASSLGKNVLHDVVNDQKVQKGAGDALWSAFTYSVTPKLFSDNSPPSAPSESS